MEKAVEIARTTLQMAESSGRSLNNYWSFTVRDILNALMLITPFRHWKKGMRCVAFVKTNSVSCGYEIVTRPSESL